MYSNVRFAVEEKYKLLMNSTNKTKNNECPECCGEGFDLDHFYETGGEEEDCYMCGGTGTYE